ncbi:MAG: hypothetical protein RH917_11350 [Lacipirellulaceae bacterium]
MLSRSRRNHNPKRKRGKKPVGEAPRLRFGLRWFAAGVARSKGCQLRRGSAYLSVTGASLIIAMISLTSMHLARLELRDSVSRGDMAYAQRLAQSSVEFGLARMELDANWRTNYTHNVETNQSPIGLTEDLAFKFFDPVDGDLSDDTSDPVEIHGIGRWGSAVYVYSVTCANAITAAEQVGPVVAANYEGGTATSEFVRTVDYVGQYFEPSLPAEAISWQITLVDVYLSAQGAAGGTLEVKLYESDAGGMPTAQIDLASFTESELPPDGSVDWHPVPFSAATNLDPAAGYCLALEGTGSGNAAEVPYATGVSQTDSHYLIGGSGTWYSSNSSQSIRYRIHGVYTTSSGSGEFQITPGSWKRTAAP